MNERPTKEDIFTPHNERVWRFLTFPFVAFWDKIKKPLAIVLCVGAGIGFLVVIGFGVDSIAKRVSPSPTPSPAPTSTPKPTPSPTPSPSPTPEPEPIQMVFPSKPYQVPDDGETHSIKVTVADPDTGEERIIYEGNIEAGKAFQHKFTDREDVQPQLFDNGVKKDDLIAEPYVEQTPEPSPTPVPTPSPNPLLTDAQKEIPKLIKSLQQCIKNGDEKKLNSFKANEALNQYFIENENGDEDIILLKREEFSEIIENSEWAVFMAMVKTKNPYIISKLKVPSGETSKKIYYVTKAEINLSDAITFNESSDDTINTDCDIDFDASVFEKSTGLKIIRVTGSFNTTLTWKKISNRWYITNISRGSGHGVFNFSRSLLSSKKISQLPFPSKNMELDYVPSLP